MEFRPYQSIEIGKLVAAFAKSQLEFPDIPKSKKGGHKSGKNWYYADLPQILEILRPILNKNGLSFHQGEQYYEGMIFLTSQLSHEETGQWIGSFKPLPTKGADQDYGAAVSYQRRYSAMALLGIHPSDEDLDNPDIREEKSINKYSNISPLEELKILIGENQKLYEKVINYNKVTSLEEMTSAQLEYAIAAIKNPKPKKQE